MKLSTTNPTFIIGTKILYLLCGCKILEEVIYTNMEKIHSTHVRREKRTKHLTSKTQDEAIKMTSNTA